MVGFMLPVLYSFRRCPYAMRARLALKVSGIQVELREVVLANKPQAMLEASAKGTVPVLVLPDHTVIEESRDIMHWALAANDPQHWWQADEDFLSRYNQLLAINDGEFKQYLDHYKYAARFPEQPMSAYRAQGEEFLRKLEGLLEHSPYLLGERPSIADMAIMPFIRQFAQVDRDWFYASPYRKLQQWLDALLAMPLFAAVMQKYPPWQAGDPLTVF